MRSDRVSSDDQRREQRLINEILELLVTHHGGGISEEELDRSLDALQRAIEVARVSHAGQLRKSGEPYFFHPLRVAHLAARYWMDFASVIAAILHDVVEDTPVTLDEVERQFGAEVARLVNGLTKAADEQLSRETLKAETYRKQLLLAGQGEIELTLGYDAQIGAFEERQRRRMPWLSEGYRD